MRPVAPSELSSLGDLHDADASVTGTSEAAWGLHRTSSRPLSFGVASTPRFTSDTALQLEHSRYQQHPHDEQQTPRGAPIHGEVPSADLRGVSALLVGIGATVGMVLAIVVAQVDGARDSAPVRWLLLPGKLYANALLCVVLLGVLLNAALATMHFATLNKTKALASKMLLYFFTATLCASILGALVALCLVPTLPENSALRASAAAFGGGSGGGLQNATIGPASPLLEFLCPQLNNSSANSSRQALLVQPDGVMRCAQPLEVINSTRFYVEDLAHTFQLSASHSSSSSSSAAAAIPTIGEQLVAVLESVFPVNLLEALARGDVLSVLLMGAALGAALLRFALISSIAGTSDSSLLFLLLVQADVVLSLLTRALLRALPVGMVFMVAGALLRGPPLAAAQQQLAPSTLELARLAGVLLFALALTLAIVLALAAAVNKASPLPFLRQLVSAQLVALGTSSSLLALPATVRGIAATRQVSMPLAHLVCSAGTVLNKTGSAVYVSVSSVYVVALAGVQGEALTGGHVVALVFASVLGAVVLPAVPRGGVLVVGTILSSVFELADAGAVHTLVAFLAAMDWLCDPLVTVVNVTSSAVVALVLAGELDERFRDPSFGSTQEEDTDDGMSGPLVAPGRPPHSGLGVRHHLEHQISSVGSSEVIL
ncbi:hypothetical protein PybrP1_008301 [[Pythium] brassicae (nom. inval.)]|nr:hypothetical protein PybrP1_008301 [[Pythium] brassicae (nom. inval.)]